MFIRLASRKYDRNLEISKLMTSVKSDHLSCAYVDSVLVD